VNIIPKHSTGVVPDGDVGGGNAENDRDTVCYRQRQYRCEKAEMGHGCRGKDTEDVATKYT
jgi:hypothetical protein